MIFQSLKIDGMLITRPICQSPDQLASPLKFCSLTLFFFFDHWSNHLLQRNPRFQAIELVKQPVPETLDMGFLFYVLQVECVTVNYKATHINTSMTHTYHQAGGWSCVSLRAANKNVPLQYIVRWPGKIILSDDNFYYITLGANNLFDFLLDR